MLKFKDILRAKTIKVILIINKLNFFYHIFMSTKILITTCIEPVNIKKKKNILYAGDWCFKNQKLIKNKNIFQNIWDTNNTIDLDYKKIKKIHTKINLKLSNYLYEIHEKKISKKIWRNLIYVWQYLLFIFLLL